MDINIYTLCRSGNHAIIFWLFNNLCPVTDEIEVCCYWNSDKGVYYYNNCSRYTYHKIFNYNYIIRSYEDLSEINYDEKSKNVIILRDFANFIASRYKKYNPSLGLDSTYLQSYEDVKKQWIGLGNDIINNKSIIGIIYDKWVLDKSYRDKIGESLGISNVLDNTSVVANIGEGSSFCGLKLEDDKNSYLQRFNPDVFSSNPELYERIKNDVENDEGIIKITKLLFTE